jgi:hypothetical protein
MGAYPRKESVMFPVDLLFVAILLACAAPVVIKALRY